MKSSLKDIAAKAGSAALWLWRLPPIRSVVVTNVVRLLGGGVIGTIFVAIADGLAQ